MAGREYRTSFRCAEPGCRDVQFLVHSTRRDEDAAYKRQHEHPYRCTRHADPDKNLRPGNEKTVLVLTAMRVQSGTTDAGQPNWLPGLFWRPEGGAAGSGFTFGPGFNAHASDFPEGTRLVITAEILAMTGNDFCGAPMADDELTAELDRLDGMFRDARHVPAAYDMDVVMDRAQAALEAVRLTAEVHQAKDRKCRGCGFQWPCATVRLITRTMTGGTDAG